MADISAPDEPDTEPSGVNPWVDAAAVSVSTFSVDVDSGSYTLARRHLNEGELPDPTTVRVEEFVNYFHYDTRRDSFRG